LALQPVLVPFYCNHLNKPNELNLSSEILLRRPRRGFHRDVLNHLNYPNDPNAPNDLTYPVKFLLRLVATADGTGVGPVDRTGVNPVQIRKDMSLVGPRPLPVRDYNGFNTDWQHRRFSIRPGITCLWQVNGSHNVSFERWMELDLEYIDQWLLLLDFSILVKTIPAVLKGSGAS